MVSITGLGELLSGFAHFFDTASIMASILFLLILGQLLTSLLERFEVALTPWRQTA